MPKPVTTAQPRPAIIYLRVSPRPGELGVSIEMQEAKCREHAERMGWSVIAVRKDEKISGKDDIQKRPGLKEVVALANEHSDAVVVVYSVSRLARRQRLLWHLLDDRDGLGLAISSVTESFDTTTPMGRAMLGMIGVWSQLEADMVSERTRDALAELKAQGKQLGNPGMKVLDPQIVEKVMKLYRSGLYSQRALVDELNRQQIPTVTGRGKWHLRTVQEVISLGKSQT